METEALVRVAQWKLAVAGMCGLPLAAAAQMPAATPVGNVFVPRPGLYALQNPAPQATAPTPATDGAAPAGRSVYRAAFLSALVPGLGEYYTGHRYRALVSGTLEGAVWTSFVTFKVQEQLRGDRAIEYATSYAGAAAGADEEYYKAVGQFLRAEGPGQWNEFVRRRARDTGEIVGREYEGGEAWAWTSLDRFIDYRQLRKGKLTAADRATNALAFALVNRIVSVVSVVQAVRSDHSRSERALGLRLEAHPGLEAPEWRVGLGGRF